MQRSHVVRAPTRAHTRPPRPPRPPSSFPLPDTHGPRFHKEEYLHLVRDTFTKLGVFNGYELPAGFDHTSEGGAIHWVTSGYGALFLEKNPSGPG